MCANTLRPGGERRVGKRAANVHYRASGTIFTRIPCKHTERRQRVPAESLTGQAETYERERIERRTKTALLLRGARPFVPLSPLSA